MENSTNCDVAIIGAGLAGLMAAISCEKAGYSVIILEATDRAGGRIKTDSKDGFLLDHGFQVLLSSYEKANSVFDMAALELGHFSAGASITDDRGSYPIGDPLRDSSLLFPMAFSRVGSLGDKFKMYQLTERLKKQTNEQVFEDDRLTTLEYLKSLGFSDKIIEHFFTPFFGGIFLERKLETPAAMFRFVFRNFALGSACLPSNGMQELPNQLLGKLKQTEIRFHAPVEKVDQSGVVTLKNGDEISAKKVIVACHPELVLPQMKDEQPFRHTTTMYFGGNASMKKMNRTIGLDARKNSPVNNYCRHDEVQPNCAPKGKSLWSVTVREDVNAQAPEVAESLSELIGCQRKELTYLHSYFIKKALPIVASPRYDLPAEQTQIGPHIYLAGDYLLNGSIEAALRSGIRAAEAVTETLDLG